MKYLRSFFVFGILCVLLVGYGHAQATLIVQEKVSVSRALAGQVNVGMGQEPAKGVTVELCSPDWKTVIASAKTDDHGHFSLEKPRLESCIISGCQRLGSTLTSFESAFGSTALRN